MAVQEFQVNTGVYSAEYGRAMGGVINSVTKSGTNQIHGELYFYDRDNDWGAKNAFTKLTTLDPDTGKNVTTQYKPTDWRKQWGFGAGGALIKDKLFWFYTYDGYRRNFPGTAVPSSPATFFSTPEATITTTNAATGQPWACPELIAAGGKGSGLPKDLDSQACMLQARLGLPSYSAAVALYNKDLAALSTVLGPVHRTGDQTINMPKIDWQINAKNHASFIYNRLRWDSPGGVQTQATNTYSADAFGNDFVKLDYGIAKLDTVFTANLINELRFQYGRELNDENAQALTPYNAQFVTASSFNGLPPSIGPPTGAFTNGVQYYSSRQAFPDERKWQIADTVSWTHGRHTFRFGGDIVHNYDLITSLGLASYSPNGEFAYQFFGNLFADIANPSGTCGKSASEFNIGTLPCYEFFEQNFGPASFDIATVDYGFFVQDDWKITPRLTANLGLRYDYQDNPSPFTSLQQPVGKFVPLPAMLNRPSDKNNFGPRVGFAYDPYGTGYKSTFLDGWNLNPLVQLQNGLPYTLTTSGFPSAASFDTGWNGAFGSPTYIPNVGRNTFKIRPAKVFDVRAEKQIPFRDRYTLQLFGECFNVFNHQNYTGINSTGYNFTDSSQAVNTDGYTGQQTYTTQLTYSNSFGTYTNSNSNYVYSPRQVQLALRLVF